MTHRSRPQFMLLAAFVLATGCAKAPNGSADPSALVGAWHAKIRFGAGPLAAMKGLEFLLAYNAGGTMTESSNYDEAANSSPPAYGVWKAIAPRQFQTKYLFFTTRAPVAADSAPKESDWWPDGHGELTETITLAEDGKSYTSTVKLVTFDRAGQQLPGESTGTGAGTRIEF